MKKGRLTRNIFMIVLGIVSFFISLCFKIVPNSFANFTDIMSASLSFSALATAMFLSLFSLIPAFSNSTFILALKDLGTDKKIMDRLLISTILFFLSSILSFVELFFCSTEISLLSQIVTAFWVSFTLMPFINTVFILIIILQGFDYYTEDEDEEEKNS